MAAVRGFITKHLPRDKTALEGATVVISAVIRKTSRGVGLRRLMMWRDGDPILEGLEAAAEAWALVEQEDG